MIADSPSQDRGVAQRPPTAGASSKRTPSGSEVMSSACSPASRWCWRSISTAFGALRSNSLSLMASGLTILASSFQEMRDHLAFVCACFQERESVIDNKALEGGVELARRDGGAGERGEGLPALLALAWLVQCNVDSLFIDL